MKVRSPSPRSTPDASPAASGFSLVEVVLAVGIMALGVVTILGLLPHGMEMSRKTANELAETRIIEQLIGELQSSEWNVLQANQGTPLAKRYYDDQGLEIQDQDEGFATRLSYVAQAEIAEPDVKLLSNVAVQPNENLRRVTVKVVSVPLRDFDFTNPPPGTPVKAFTQLVVKMR